MNLIKFSIKNPIVIIVIALIIAIFGYISSQLLPIQLTPSVTKPVITVTTTWGGATPYEIESDIIKEQEKVLKNLDNLIEYEGTSSNGVGTIKLTFKLQTDIDKALNDVSSKLDEVPSYPQNVNRPIVKEAMDSPLIWTMLQTTDNNPRHIDTYRTYFEDYVKEHLERVDGVAELQIIGGTKEQMHITLDMQKVSQYALSIPKIITLLQNENINISAGTKDVDRRTYRIRTVSKLGSTKDIENLIVYSDRQRKIYLKDIASVDYGYQAKKDFAMLFGKDGIFIGVKPTSSANVVTLTNNYEKVVNKLNSEVLNKKDLQLIWVSDKRGYIKSSVDLVKKNILIGGVLAIIILILFLRAISPTSVVAIAIPISVLGTFIILLLMDRTFNTIALAGISFAVGMLVDSAIVVLENIDRHRKMGKDIIDAAYDGTLEVWGALLGSAATTIAVFLPILFLEDEAGQLFKDIAIAVVSSVTFALFVSITLIPMLWRYFASFSKVKEHKKSSLSRFGEKLVDIIMNIVGYSLKNFFTKIATITLLTVISFGTIYALFPKLDYLPHGNKNMIFNLLFLPPGISYKEKHDIGDYLYKKLDPYIKGKDGSPPISAAYCVSMGDMIIFGLKAKDETRARELIPVGRPIISSVAGTFGFSVQSGVFDTGLGKGKTVDVDISGDDMDHLVKISGKVFMKLKQELKKTQIRPVPSIEMLYPEMQIKPNKDALIALGLDSKQLGTIIDVVMDGRKIGDFEEEGKNKIDLILKAKDTDNTVLENILSNQIALQDNKLIPLSSLASIENKIGISTIRHFNGKRTITLQVTPPKNMTIEEMVELVKNIIEKNKKQLNLKNETIDISGTSDQLTQTINILSYNFIVVLLIIYLLLVVLFKNFLYPIIILFTVPLATAGGFIGLKMTNIFLSPQPLDVLTMLGFIILVGIVVNNSILIVHQFLNISKKEQIEHKTAILEATKSRIRPIYMSSLTSIFGMLPLVLIPGAGSEFYRGLGSVITGGLAFSTIFTIFITPALLLLFVKLMETGKRIKNKRIQHEI